MSLTVMRYDPEGLRFLPAKLSECSVFVWSRQSTVYRPMGES